MATLLVVDDEYGIAELLAAIFTDEGHRVLAAPDGEHGLRLLAREGANLVFLDFMMPVMSGAEMLEAVLADASWCHIPVVMMSSLPEAIVVTRCSGYAAYLRKPFKVSQVVALAGHLLGLDEWRVH